MHVTLRKSQCGLFLFFLVKVAKIWLSAVFYIKTKKTSLLTNGFLTFFVYIYVENRYLVVKVVFLCGLKMNYGGRHQIETITNHLAVHFKNE